MDEVAAGFADATAAAAPCRQRRPERQRSSQPTRSRSRQRRRRATARRSRQPEATRRSRRGHRRVLRAPRPMCFVCRGQLQPGCQKSWANTTDTTAPRPAETVAIQPPAAEERRTAGFAGRRPASRLRSRAAASTSSCSPRPAQEPHQRGDCRKPGAGATGQKSLTTQQGSEARSMQPRQPAHRHPSSSGEAQAARCEQADGLAAANRGARPGSGHHNLEAARRRQEQEQAGPRGGPAAAGEPGR